MCGAFEAIASLADRTHINEGMTASIKSVDDIDQGQGTVLVPPVADDIPTTVKCLAKPIPLKLEHPFDLGGAYPPAIGKAAPRF